MTKIIICDQNREVVEALKKTLSGPSKTGIEFEFVVGDVIDLHEKTPGSRIVTASNPSFSPDGGLDAALAKKYPWAGKEFTWDDHLFYVISVSSDRGATKDIIQRALCGVLAHAPKFTLLLTGIGTGVGGLLIDILADVAKTILSSANLSSAKIVKVIHNEITAHFALACPEEGAFIGWKKAGKYIVKLQITEKAKRSSATTRKCRASEALVLAIYDGKKKVKTAVSSYDPNFKYEVGKIVIPTEPFCKDRWQECASGLHFFLTRSEAEMWIF